MQCTQYSWQQKGTKEGSSIRKYHFNYGVLSVVEVQTFKHRVCRYRVGILSILKFRVRSNFNAKLLPFSFMLHPKEEWVLIGATRPDCGHDGKLLGKPSFSYKIKTTQCYMRQIKTTYILHCNIYYKGSNVLRKKDIDFNCSPSYVYETLRLIRCCSQLQKVKP